MNGLAPGQSAEDAVAAMLAPTAAIVPPTSSLINVTLSVEVPDADIVDLLETAACGGVNYWCRSMYIDDARRTVRIDLLTDDDEPEFPTHRVLKFEWIAKRLVQLGTGQEVDGSFSSYAMLRRQAARYVGDVMNGGEDGMDLDAEVADVVVQLAYFNGIVVFG